MLSPNNSRGLEILVPEAPSSPRTHKREKEQLDNKEKSCKMLKLSEADQHWEKENVDPRLSATTVICL